MDVATELARRMRWRTPHAREGAQELARFLDLLSVAEERADKPLSPSPQVDELWHAVLENVDVYCWLRGALNNAVLAHFPRRELDTGAEKQERYVRTTKAYAEKYGPLPRTWWPDCHPDYSPPQGPPAPIVWRGGCQLFVVWLDGRTITFDVNTNEDVWHLRERVADRTGTNCDTVRLKFNGRELFNGNTLACYGVTRECTIRAYLPLRGC